MDIIKNQRKASKKAREKYVYLSEQNKKIKSVNMFVNDIDIVLMKRKTKSVNTFATDIKAFLVEYRKNYSKIWKNKNSSPIKTD